MPVYPGNAGYCLFQEEVTPGTFLMTTPETLWATANTSTETAEQIIRSYYTGDRASAVGVQTGKVNVAGQLSYPLFPNVGMRLLYHALGKATFLTAIADTTAGATTTALGQSSFTLTTGGAYLPGSPLYYNTGANQERVTIISYNSGTKAMVTTALQLAVNVAHAAGTVTSQPAQHRITHRVYADIPTLDATALPTSSMEFLKGGKVDWRFAGCFPAQYNVAGGNQDVAVTLDFIANGLQPHSATPTVLAPTATESLDQSRFFTIMDGVVIVPADPTNSGTNTLQAALKTKTWGLSINNTAATTPYWDQQTLLQHYATTLNITANYAYDNQTSRVPEFDDYMLGAPTSDTPFIVQLAKNIGTPSAPVWTGANFYVKHLHFTNAPDQAAIGSLETVAVTGTAIRPTGDTLIDVFVQNSRVTTYGT